MTKRRHRHAPGGGLKAVVYGSAEDFGPMLNARHPRKFKLDKKTAQSADNTLSGKEAQHDT